MTDRAYHKDPDRVKASLDNSIRDGSAFSFMEVFGKAYIVPFAMALNASTTMIGALSSLPDLIGSLFQFFSTSVVEKIGSRKKVVLLFAFIQALLWIPLFFA